jgi:hypothetical protein
MAPTWAQADKRREPDLPRRTPADEEVGWIGRASSGRSLPSSSNEQCRREGVLCYWIGEDNPVRVIDVFRRPSRPGGAQVKARCYCVAKLRTGNPADAGTDVGPLITAESRDRVASYLANARYEVDRIWSSFFAPHRAGSLRHL